MPISKKWVLKPQGDPTLVASLAEELQMSPVLANLLVQRGIGSREEAERFFNPRLSDLYDPFLMKDMEQAIERIESALSKGEKMMIYGDYDVDGTTAVALVYIFFRRLGYDDNLLFYIPDRYAEGYGVSYKGIDYAESQGVSLIITLDCGIKAVEKVEYARGKGIDFIISDHHLPGDELPNAVAVLDPKRADCTYPFKDLSGCGVGFKLVHAYAIKKGVAFSEVESLLDLVVVSIAADIVPLVDENRTMSYFGLQLLNSKPNKGLMSIIKICGLGHQTITIDDIVFKIGPRINAAGRMRVSELDQTPSGGHWAVNLMIERDTDMAQEFGMIIDDQNSDRKSIDRVVTQEAHDFVEQNPNMKRQKSIVIYNPNWMKGIVGIVASRLIETYYRPTVILTKSKEFVTGSARSVPGFDLYKAVESCADLLENFGGHMYAAGLTMRPENVDTFIERFNKYVDQNIDPEMLIPTVEIDAMLKLSEIDGTFRRQLAHFQPFGPGNTAPVFATRRVSNRGDARLVGVDHDHLRMDVTQREKPNTTVAAIAFQQPNNFEYIRRGGEIDISYVLVENLYRGIVTPQLRIRDIKMAQEEQQWVY